MAQLTGNRNTPERDLPDGRDDAVRGADSTQFVKGGLVAMTPTGLLVRQTGSGTNVTCGVSLDNVLTGVSNTVDIKLRQSTHIFANGDGSTIADRGSLCYAGDDQTVFRTSTGGRPVAGRIYDVDARGVHVRVSDRLGSPGLGATGS